MPELNAGSNLPTFIADVRSEKAIQVALNFARNHQLKVSIKTTGWSYTGSSSSYGSLMILMSNFPKDGKVLKNFTDTCGSTYDNAVAVGGGEWIDDVLEEVGDEHFTAFAPFTRSISAAGGYLQGGGVSWISRTYGLAIDQVIDFHVVSASGQSIIANECTNPDLFWALKGGGGGTFGVVTKVHYKLEPKTPFIVLSFNMFGQKQAYAKREEQEYTAAIRQWLEFWIQKSPHLDHRWSGTFGVYFCTLFFFGPREEATFIDELTEWYDNILQIPRELNRSWGATRPEIQEQYSWYQYRGGSVAYRNPIFTAETLFADQLFVTSRLVARDYVVNEPEELLDFLMDLSMNGTAWQAPNFLLGGKVNEVPVSKSSVHPMMRKSIWAIYVFRPDGQAKMKHHFDRFEENAAIFNMGAVSEKRWKEVQWGPNYAKLFEIKKKYDPYSLFYCFHCIGYDGDEVPVNSFN